MGTTGMIGAGGGGGSSYTEPGALGVSMTAGAQMGNGTIALSY
jgi:hypothetical protein